MVTSKRAALLFLLVLAGARMTAQAVGGQSFADETLQTAIKLPTSTMGWLVRWGDSKRGIGVAVKDFSGTEISLSERTSMVQLQATSQLLRATSRSQKALVDFVAKMRAKAGFPDALPELLVSVDGSLPPGASVSMAHQGDVLACVVKCDSSEVIIKSIQTLPDKDIWDQYRDNVLRLARDSLGSGGTDQTLQYLFSLKKQGLESRELYITLRDAYLARNQKEEAQRVADYLSSHYPEVSREYP